MSRLPIVYRDFYDVPRHFAVERDGRTYLFDSPFDESADEYPAIYRVYEIPVGSVAIFNTSDWVDFTTDDRLIGWLPVSEVEFDSTRRQSIGASVFSRVRGG